MNSKAMDLVEYLQAIQRVKMTSLLSESQRMAVYKDLKYELPPEMYCVSCKETRQIIEKVLEDHIDVGKKEEGKSPTKTTKKSKHDPREEQLLLDPDVNTRGKGAKKRVVNKTAQKRRQAEGSA